ncbi:hypothetical protein [Methanoplanus endosymbiosus]|uniref:Resolvase HTH domain-containing protein n=1 Tax=Methanoplanus endosymbiosus TaxID=33865 RepID=A0A9E7PQJ7_9EURY|nr:hypothetical protein [Methanoplanus endosymbiosus]UUX93131.1 hypothetical protein L6E24_03135 [Methanoplanus endosymbiosus]
MVQLFHKVSFFRLRGVVLGRPKGSKSKRVKLSGQEDVIRVLLERKVSKCEIARIFGVHRTTVDNFIKERMLSRL